MMLGMGASKCRWCRKANASSDDAFRSLLKEQGARCADDLSVCSDCISLLFEIDRARKNSLMLESDQARDAYYRGMATAAKFWGAGNDATSIVVHHE